MNEIERAYYEEIREKKRTATGAFHRAARGQRSFAVHNQSDHLTKKEVKALSGEIHEYNIKQPLLWRQYQLLETDVKKLYLKTLVNDYGANAAAIAEMLGISCRYAIDELKKRDLYHGRKYMTIEERLSWQRFIGGDAVDEPCDDGNTPQMDVCDNVVNEDKTTPQTASALTTIESVNISLIGEDKKLLLRDLCMIVDCVMPSDGGLMITVEVVK